MLCPPTYVTSRVCIVWCILLYSVHGSSLDVQNNKRASSPPCRPCLWVVIADPAVFSSKELEACATIALEVLGMTSAQWKTKTERCATCPTRVRKCQGKARTKGRISVQVQTERGQRSLNMHRFDSVISVNTVTYYSSYRHTMSARACAKLCTLCTGP